MHSILKHSHFLLLVVMMLSWNNAQSQNKNISQGVLFNGEPNLVVNPSDPQHLVVSWMGVAPPDYSSLHIRTKVSFDGGTTWGHLTDHPHPCTNCTSADPTMAFHKQGMLYLVYIDYISSTCNTGGIYIRSSEDGGQSWSTPMKAWDVNEISGEYPIDRPWLVVDNSGQPSSETLYLTTMPATRCGAAPPNEPYLKVSSDSGQTWSNYDPIDTPGYEVGNIPQPMASPAVTSNGAFFAVYPSYKISQSPYARNLWARSDDKGSSFSQRGVAVDSLTGNNLDTLSKKGTPLIACPGDSNKMAFLWPGGKHGDQDIFATTTSDGGQTWSGHQRVNDDPKNNGKVQDLAWGSYNEDGDLVVTWRDRRDASGSGYEQDYKIYGAISTDNGQTFGPNFEISDTQAPYDTILEEAGNDFMDCALIGDTLHSVWGDTRGGELEIYYDRRTVSTSAQASSSSYSPSFKTQVFARRQQLRVELPELRTIPEGSSLTVTDLLGRKQAFFHLHKNASTYPLPALRQGIYLYRLHIPGKAEQTGKFYLPGE